VKEDKLWVYQKVMELMASRVGDVLNYSIIAAQVEVTVDTVKRYSLLLEKTFILTNLTTCSRNIRNEVLKTPKIYFSDLGLRNILLGLTSVAQLERINQYGVALENSMANRLSAWLPLLNPELRLHYWRTRSQEEVDLVISAPDRLIPVEVKSDKKLQKKDLKGLRRFLEKEKEKTGILVGRFEEADILEEGQTEIILLPYWII
jgi:predicted AAA+ superfamily ATPase